jgi:hypothetical protein
MPTTYGTAYFRSTRAAVEYYAEYGFSAEDVKRKIAAKEIHVWEKPPTKPGERVILIDGGRRYAVVES